MAKIYTIGSFGVGSAIASLVILSSSLAISNQEAIAKDLRGVDSIYTNLTGSQCRQVSITEPSGSVSRCVGFGKYKLLVLEDDLRVSVNVITPTGKTFPLNYWQVITSNFSSLGNKAEWRVSKKQGKVSPFALIIRVNAYEFPEQPEKFRSYLAVAKITANQICVIDKIPPSANQNQLARQAADNSGNKPCI
ncbi:hypothetical protein [Merismopedia glauca]|uniref:Uncharacterized protein n=1 Tax=Merismopedia glauca CCAP 1448/3 TaxID=1296344 RepID=A0A2T1C4Z4_9CYAN|nr:hypothetical protein [Merismopedia glauca]PSB03329.1 hypothetical protein C7B64_09145 [Merismopedia glauca CCAP 1448/3]